MPVREGPGVRDHPLAQGFFTAEGAEGMVKHPPHSFAVNLHRTPAVRRERGLTQRRKGSKGAEGVIGGVRHAACWC